MLNTEGILKFDSLKSFKDHSMKSKISLLLAIVMIAFATTQCKKKKAEESPAEEPPITPAGPVLTTIAEVFTVAGSPTQSYTVSATSGMTLNVNNVIIEIPANSFETTSSGTVSGVVDVKVRTILTKRQVILSGASGGTSNSKLVTTKGCVKVTASQNTQSLRLVPAATVHVKVPEGPSFPPSTQKFYAGKISASDSTLIWSLGTDVSNIPPALDTANATFQHNATLDSLKWLNVGTVWDSLTTNKGPVIVKVDGSQFTKANCAIYLSLNGSNITIGALTEIFNGTYRISNIPNGRGVTLVAIAIINGQYYSAIQTTITGAAFYSLNLVPISLSQLQTNLDALP